MSEVAYAVAVREPEGLFLVVSIVRPVTGDVYVNWPRDGVPGWKPHTSYHASGQHHHKAFGKIGLKRQSTPPNADFNGEKNVVTMSVNPGDHRAVNVPCVESNCAEVFEVPSSQLTEHTLLSVDLVEVGGDPRLSAPQRCPGIEYRGARDQRGGFPMEEAAAGSEGERARHPRREQRRHRRQAVRAIAPRRRAAREGRARRANLKGKNRLPIRAHDLRGTFVTLSLANDRTEAWVQDRTGHTSSNMINLYRRTARTAAELGLGELLPLDEAIPELRSKCPTHGARGAADPPPEDSSEDVSCGTDSTCLAPVPQGSKTSSDGRIRTFVRGIKRPSCMHAGPSDRVYPVFSAT